MNLIYKYSLEITDSQTLFIYGLNKILSVINQRETLVLYASINKTIHQKSMVDIAIVGTGQPNWPEDEGWNFLNSVSIEEGNFIWHIYFRILREQDD